MEPTQRINWLDLSTKQIEEESKTKLEEEKKKSIETMNALTNLESHLLKCINLLDESEKSLMKGGKECGTPFVNNISNYIDELSIVGQLSAELDTMAFPIALCDYIDQGKNPDLQMKQNYSVTQTKNNIQRSRIINTHCLEKYLQNGQQYFNKWSNEKRKQVSINHDNNNKKNSKPIQNNKQENDKEEDDDIVMS